MPSAHLTLKLVDELICPDNKKKIDYFDTEVTGFLVETRVSGGKTYYVRYRTPRGSIRQAKIGNAKILKLADARRQAQKYLAQVAMGVDPAEHKETLRQVPTLNEFLISRYIPYIEGYKRKTISEKSYIRNHISPYLGRKHLDLIKQSDVISMQHEMRIKGYSRGTCNRCLRLVKHALNMAVKWEIPLITRNVSQGVPAYEDPPTKERFLTQEETQRLFEAVLLSENTMLRYIVPMLILTGARKHEVLEARWEDFDTDSHQWRIPKTKSGKPRYVPLSDSVIELLEAIPRHEESEWIFTNPKTNKPYTRFYKSWDRARRIANLADVRIHDLRHSFASFLVNSGRSIYEVQKILGHSDVRVTQRYAHLSQNTLTDAANKVGEILNFKF